MNNLSNFTKIFLAVGLIFVLYGYLSRIVGLYFFWESKSIGWAIALIGLISLISGRIQSKRQNNKNTILEKIGISTIIFILLVQAFLVIMIPFSDAYSTAKNYLWNNHKLIQEIGRIKGLSLIPAGGIRKTKDSNGTSGLATINLTIKGEKKYKDITIFVVKYADQPEWIVEEIN